MCAKCEQIDYPAVYPWVCREYSARREDRISDPSGHGELIGAIAALTARLDRMLDVIEGSPATPAKREPPARLTRPTGGINIDRGAQ